MYVNITTSLYYFLTLRLCCKKNEIYLCKIGYFVSCVYALVSVCSPFSFPVDKKRNKNIIDN